MQVTDFYVNCPTDERQALMESLQHLRVWVEGDDDNLWLQGHPGVCDELVKTGYSFSMCTSGSIWDLWVEFKDGEETYSCNDHGMDDNWYHSISVEQYNEVWDNLSNDEFIMS